ncbi:MAG: aminomethyltransferase family protein [Anaerolineae bacterium]|jgi:aminomethyltransferase
MKRSPFYSEIASYSPSFVTVQGWEVPNEFTSVADEHRAVRERVGLMDWSSTGEFEVKGPDALAVVQRLIVNDASTMLVNRVLYTSILDEAGGILSDITVYRLAEEHYMLMTAWGSNADNERPEYDLLQEYCRGRNAFAFDASPGVGLLALQGPQSRALLSELTPADLDNLPYMWALPAQMAGARALISRTGYTGELGYEILIPAEHAHDVWQALIDAGERFGLALCGLAVAFGLRIEKGYIMRFDFAGGRTPYEVGLGWTAKLDKGDFLGREALIQRKEAGITEKLVALALQDDYVPATGDAILDGDEPTGVVTSAAYGYAVQHPIALGYVPVAFARVGTRVIIRDGEGDRHPARVAERSAYDPQGARLRS